MAGRSEKAGIFRISSGRSEPMPELRSGEDLKTGIRKRIRKKGSGRRRHRAAERGTEDSGETYFPGTGQKVCCEICGREEAVSGKELSQKATRNALIMI